jgi:TolB-like protein
MASVFLSYAREDAAKAKTLARAMEAAGHSVWWDNHIRGGAEFAGEIEQALDGADAVVVLWSEASVASSWVRDEATEGRESGRLVPVQLDDSRPPIGFRQLQTVDLKGWSGRGTPKGLAALLSALGGVKAAEHRPAPQPAAKPRFSRNTLVLAALGLLLALAAGAWLVLRQDRAAAATPTIAVLPFADLSPGRDKAYFSEGVAEEILSVLARDPGIRVIGRSSARQFSQSSADPSSIRQALGVTHVLEGSARAMGDELRMSVRLIDASTSRQVWAEDYQRKLNNVFAVQAEIGQAVAERLRGSLSPKLQDAQLQPTATDTYALYLAARAKMRERTMPALQEALRLARRVIASDPKYASGHALYAETLWLLSEDNYGRFPMQQVWPIARRHALQAIRLAPGSADGYAALGVVPPPEQAVAALRKAIALDPSRSELRLWLAGALNELGRNDEALEQHRAAAEMEPIWAPAVRNYVQNLASSGRYAEAQDLVNAFERRGGAPAHAALIRSQLAGFAGDLSEALRQSELSIRLDPNIVSGSPLHPFMYHDLGFFGRAAELARGQPRLQLSVAGRYRELAERVKAEGLWADSHLIAGLEALSLVRDWRGIADQYDARPQGLDVCRQNGNQVPILFAKALMVAGRTAEAAQLIRCARQTVALQSGGPVFSPYYAENWLLALEAMILAVEGKGDAALAALRRAVRLGYYAPYGHGMNFLPLFDPWRNTPAYRALDAELKAKVAAERRETLADPLARGLR